MARRTAPPPRLKARGRQLWAACLATDETLTDSHNPYRVILVNACQVADVLDAMDALIRDQGAIVKGKPHMLLREQARCRALLPRLIAALRMPDAHGRRPQRRGSRFERMSPSKR